jgi:hypothetical protein
VITGTPAGIRKEVRQVPQEPPVAAPQPLPPLRLQGSTPPAAGVRAAAMTPVQPRRSLWDQVYAYGLAWRPSHKEQIRQEVVRMLKQAGEMGNCLRDLNDTMGPGMLADQMVEEFSRGYAVATRQRVATNYYSLILAAPPPANGRSPRSCVAPPERPAAFSYRVLPKLQSFGDAKRGVAELSANDRGSGLAREWRLPSALEAFAIASAVMNDANVTKLSFWAETEGVPGILSIRKPVKPGTTTVTGPPSIDLSATNVVVDQARLLAVHN